MSFSRRTRYIYWIIKDLSQKYTRSLLLGFFLGFLIAISYWRLSPIVKKTWFTPVDRIGIVGDFGSENLPLSIQKQISMGLTTLSDAGLPLPGIAKSWEATDSGRRFVFTLRNDLKWHNGKPVTAFDIKYNIKNVTFSVVNEFTIEARLENPYSPFPVIVSKPVFLEGLIGNGPYKVTSIKLKGNSIQSMYLIPISDDEDLRPKEYRFYRTETQATTAFKLGEVDILQDISNPKELAAWGENKIFETVRYDRIVAVFFNMKDHLMSEKGLRQALAYAMPILPQEEADSPISVKSWAYSGNIKTYGRDIHQAKKLLENSKVATDSPHITLTTFDSYLEDAQAVANSWSEIGIKTEIKVEKSVPDAFQALLSAVDLPPDPDQYLLWHSTQSNTNVTGYANVRIDKLLEDGRQEFNPEVRKKIYADFARILVDDAPALFMYYPKTYTVYRRHLP